ncbi:hypothetical protein B0H12DRAFT_1117040 [Mycena haematopus]|nr:hypothetical protein B0H12DRAFT_1117040 [Mycena haematopus]
MQSRACQSSSSNVLAQSHGGARELYDALATAYEELRYRGGGERPGFELMPFSTPGISKIVIARAALPLQRWRPDRRRASSRRTQTQGCRCAAGFELMNLLVIFDPRRRSEAQTVSPPSAPESATKQTPPSGPTDLLSPQPPRLHRRRREHSHPPLRKRRPAHP